MLIEITSLPCPGTEMFCSLTEAQLRQTDGGVFIAESPKVIDRALEDGYQPLALLCERKHITGDARHIIESYPDMPVYTGERSVLATLTGYTLTRGVLCAMRRPALKTVDEVCAQARRVVVIDNVVDAVNIGSIFRSAAALGFDAVLLTPTCCDPFNRRVVRVSMGTIFQVPWTIMHDPITSLHRLGFKTAAMALTKKSVPLDDPTLKAQPKLAIIMGNEGDGLEQHVIDEADFTVLIPMAHHVDSLNVATAAAVAFWELRTKDNSI